MSLNLHFPSCKIRQCCLHHRPGLRTKWDNISPTEASEMCISSCFISGKLVTQWMECSLLGRASVGSHSRLHLTRPSVSTPWLSSFSSPTLSTRPAFGLPVPSDLRLSTFVWLGQPSDLAWEIPGGPHVLWARAWAFSWHCRLPRGGPCCLSLCIPCSQCFRPLSVLQNHLSFHLSWSLPMRFPRLDCLHFLPCDSDQVSPPSETYPWFPKSLSHLESQSPSLSCTHHSPEMAHWLHLEFPRYLVGLLKEVKGFIKFSHVPCWGNKRKIDVHGKWNKI